MKKSTLLLSAISLSLAGLSLTAVANTIAADDFVEEASAQGIAEVEAGKLALQKSTSASVKAFAQQMIADHTAANSELAAVAARKNLELDSEAELLSKAKAFALKQRDGESFDAAYASNQVAAHERAIELFQKGAKSDDADIRAYAAAALPKLEKHLHKAHDLAASTAAIKIEKKTK